MEGSAYSFDAVFKDALEKVHMMPKLSWGLAPWANSVWPKPARISLWSPPDMHFLHSRKIQSKIAQPSSPLAPSLIHTHMGRAAEQEPTA